MRGNKITPASQAFIGHFNYPRQIIWGGSQKGDKVFSISEFNGIFEWQFHGESSAHVDNREIEKYYENIQGENYRVDRGGLTLNKNHCRPSEILRTMKLKDQGLREAVNSVNLRNGVNTGLHQIGQPDEEEEEPNTLDLNPYQLPEKDREPLEETKTPYSFKDSQAIAQNNHDRYYPPINNVTDTFARETKKENKEELRNDLYKYYSNEHPEKTLDPIIQANLMNYKYEAIDISMSHSLAYSSSYKQKNNIVWNQEERWIAYTFESVVIIEKLNIERTQKFLKEGNDTLSDLKLSPSGKLLMAYTYNASIDGLPMIYVWDAVTLKKVSEISINQRVLVSADFSPNSNFILVVSFDDTDEDNPNSVVAIWDFTDGNCEPLCRSHIPYEIKGASWNYFLKNLEFATWNNTQYYFWKVTDALSFQYQEGSKEFRIDPDKPDEQLHSIKLGNDEEHAKITDLQFAYPIHSLQTVFLLIGLSNGYVWGVDSRTNSLLSQVKISDTAILNLQPKENHIVVAKADNNYLSCWKLPDEDNLRRKSYNLFSNEESTLLLDGTPKAMFLNELTAEGFATTTSGTIWFIDWQMETTLKINSFHLNNAEINKFGFKYVSPGEFEISEKKGDEIDYEFDKNYHVMSTSSDGILKLWNMHTSEQIMQFVVAKEQCT